MKIPFDFAKNLGTHFNRKRIFEFLSSTSMYLATINKIDRKGQEGNMNRKYTFSSITILETSDVQRHIYPNLAAYVYFRFKGRFSGLNLNFWLAELYVGIIYAVIHTLILNS